MAWRNPWWDPEKTHHARQGFRNPEDETRRPEDLKRWRRERKAMGLPRPPQQGYAHFIQRWWQPADISGSDDRVWWLGHACVLLRIRQRYILIDPALSPRASPLFFLGPERKSPAPLQIGDLPRLDYLLVSHNHYDHLDYASVRQILRRFPDVQCVVPLGLEIWFRQRGARFVHSLDWWQSLQQDDIRIDAVPARHWSMRTFWDRNRSLWCGWAVIADDLRFWFSGDSGYHPRLLEIPQRLGPFNLAALPVGAWAPEWFMQAHHMNPQQAVELYKALNQPTTIPIHWGVFELADESLDEPPGALALALDAAGLSHDRFAPWRIGEGRAIETVCRVKGKA